MYSPNERELLELWEQGQFHHPIDRALLLCTRARPDLNPDTLALLPLGTINGELLRLRAVLFGDRLELQAACDHCRELLEVTVVIGELLERVDERENSKHIYCEGFCFRPPASRDLAAVAYELDGESAALRLLEACCLSRPEGRTISLPLLKQVDGQLEEIDPLADLCFAAVCPGCGNELNVALDPGVLLWEELQAYARGVVGQVHMLASAYGWTESEVLALSPNRRKVYLDLAGGG